MARTLYSKLLYSGQPSTGSHQVYAVPSGHIAIVRDIIVVYESSTPGNIIVSGDDAIPIVFEISRAVNTYSQWKGRQVLNDGDHLVINASHTFASVRVTGYVLLAA